MVVVKLSPLEAKAYEATKGKEDWEIEDFLFLDAWTQFPALDAQGVQRGVQPLVNAARSARRKIAEATAFTIEVEGADS